MTHEISIPFVDGWPTRRLWDEHLTCSCRNLLIRYASGQATAETLVNIGISPEQRASETAKQFWR